MNPHDQELTGPFGRPPSSDDLYQIVSELLALAADQHRLVRRYARLADRMDILADATGWPAQPEIRASGREIRANGTGRAGRVMPDPHRSGFTAALPGGVRLAGDPGS